MLKHCEWCHMETNQDKFCSEICAEQAQIEDKLNNEPGSLHLQSCDEDCEIHHRMPNDRPYSY